MAKSKGKSFEHQFQDSAQRLELFEDRIKDSSNFGATSKNKYDYYLYKKPHLFCLELKSTKNKSVSCAENVIRPHQIEHLRKASTHDGVISGFVFNFRLEDNPTYFLHINEYLKYRKFAKGELTKHNIQSKINKSSIPLDYCREAGIEIKNYKKITNYHYHLDYFIDEAIKKYGNLDM